MGVFRKVSDWVAEKSNRIVRGKEGEPMMHHAAGSVPQDGMGDEGAQKPVIDLFGRGEGEYGGRVPYRSRYDREEEPVQQQQPAYQQQPAQAQPMQQAYQHPAQAQPMQQQAYQQPVQAQPMQQQAYQQPAQPQPMQQQAYRQPAQAQPRSRQQAAQQQAGNVVTFPGMQQTMDGAVYAHVEYVVLLRSLNECKDVIAYIKTNASVFLNMEFIASDSERQRCVDMLSGAAYTLGCALNKISPRGIYLISSPSVRVVLDAAIQKFSAVPEAQGFARQRYDAEPRQEYAAQQAEPAKAEERQFAGGFSSGSPTTRFQAQGTQRMPASFGSVMAGNATSSFAPAAMAH